MIVETAKCYRASCGRRFFTMKGALSREFWIRFKNKHVPNDPYHEDVGIDEALLVRIRARYVRFWIHIFKKGKGA